MSSPSWPNYSEKLAFIVSTNIVQTNLSSYGILMTCNRIDNSERFAVTCFCSYLQSSILRVEAAKCCKRRCRLMTSHAGRQQCSQSLQWLLVHPEYFGMKCLQFAFFTHTESRDSSVGIATGWMSGYRFPVGAIFFSLLHNVPASSGPTQPPIRFVLYCLTGGKATGAWSWPVNFI
jgi:hypothetical protein